MERRSVPSSAAVAVVGAGLSGLVAARRLEQAGVRDVVVLEARDRVGGRLHRLERPGGGTLEIGGEFTSADQLRLRSLAAEVGVPVVPLACVEAAAGGAAAVRLHAGVRHVEATPFAADPALAAAHAGAIARLDALAATIPPAAPWEAPAARRLDAQSLESWLEAAVEEPPVRAALATSLALFGAGPAELSLLFVLWAIASVGSFAAYEAEVSARFDPGPSEIVRRVAAQLASPVLTAAPVRRVERDDDGVTLRGDRGAVRARVAVLALAPSQCAKVEFAPVLPVLRDRAQARWLQGPGGKVFAIYDEPWWRAEGLAGLASGHALVPFALDVSPADGREGVLCGLLSATGESVAAHGAALDDPVAFRTAALDALAAYFGPRAAAPAELHWHLWYGDRWGDGCGTGPPPGVMSTTGPALSAPVGRIVWAGAETGRHEHMEGAVEAGERAAREAIGML